jgi:hypothetical protein
MRRLTIERGSALAALAVFSKPWADSLRKKESLYVIRSCGAVAGQDIRRNRSRFYLLKKACRA